MTKTLCMVVNSLNYIPETLKKPIDDLTRLFSRLEKIKFLRVRDHYFRTYVGAPTPFIKLDNITDHLGGAQIYKSSF